MIGCRFLSALSLLAAASANRPTVSATIRPEPLPSVITKMEQAAERRHADLCSYNVDRRYTIQNKHLSSKAVMNVYMVYQLGKGKHFETPSLPGVQGLVRHSLLNLLKEEERTSQEPDQSGNINSANYHFASPCLENLGARACYRVRLKPRRKSKYLVEGEAWIDAKEYAVVQIKGQLAQKPSFWVKRPEIEQCFEEIQNFCLPSYNRSVAHIAFVGETILTIEYSNDQVNLCRHSP